jgi:hypothetical protein
LHRQSSPAQLINDSRSPEFGRYLGPYLLARLERYPQIYRPNVHSLRDP